MDELIDPRPGAEARAFDSDAPGSDPAEPPARWGWWVVFALVALELTTFVSYARREITWAYPGAHDQTAYLLQTYEVNRDMAARGLPAAVRAHLAKPNAAGVLLPLQGAVHSAILGPGRMAALSVNFVHFALFQCAFVATILWLTRNWWIALSGFGLTLGLATVFQPAGGAFDFRMDFVSFCLFGVLLCALIRSQALLDPRWSAAVGTIGTVLILFRFITAVYLTGIFGGLLLVLLFRRLAARDAGARLRATGRLRGWLVAVGIIALVVGPVFHQQRKAIHAYYVVGHVTSSEKDIRAAEEAHANRASGLLYYPRSVVTDHAGAALWRAAGALVALGALGLVRVAFAPPLRRARGTQPGTLRGTALLVLLGFAVPFLVLNANAMKSPVVGIIFLPSILWAVLAPVIATAELWKRRPVLLRTLAVGTLLVGFVGQLDSATAPNVYTRAGDSNRQTMRAFDDLADACEKRGLSSPELFTDACTPDFQGLPMQIAEYERRGRWRVYRDSGISIFAGDDEAHFQRVTRAEVVLLSGVAVGAFRFPYDHMMERLRPRLKAYCDANLIKIGEYEIGGRLVTTYVRPRLRVEGSTSDGWIADRGVTLKGTLADLTRCRRIELRREVHPNFLGRVPGVTAEVELGNGPPRPLVASATADLAAVGVEWEPVAMPADTPVTIRIRFDASFVPRDQGRGSDSRSLVMSLGPQPRAHLLTERPK